MWLTISNIKQIFSTLSEHIPLFHKPKNDPDKFSENHIKRFTWSWIFLGIFAGLLFSSLFIDGMKLHSLPKKVIMFIERNATGKSFSAKWISISMIVNFFYKYQMLWMNNALKCLSCHNWKSTMFDSDQL